jgi:hypothetical protein
LWMPVPAAVPDGVGAGGTDPAGDPVHAASMAAVSRPANAVAAVRWRVTFADRTG